MVMFIVFYFYNKLIQRYRLIVVARLLFFFFNLESEWRESIVRVAKFSEKQFR